MAVQVEAETAEGNRRRSKEGRGQHQHGPRAKGVHREAGRRAEKDRAGSGEAEQPEKEGGSDSEGKALNALLRSCFLLPYLIFNGSWSPQWLLHQSNYILDKAFVRAVIGVSRWLGEERFPDGLYGLWPPPAPAEYSFAG